MIATPTQWLGWAAALVLAVGWTWRWGHYAGRWFGRWRPRALRWPLEAGLLAGITWLAIQIAVGLVSASAPTNDGVQQSPALEYRRSFLLGAATKGFTIVVFAWLVPRITRTPRKNLGLVMRPGWKAVSAGALAFVAWLPTIALVNQASRSIWPETRHVALRFLSEGTSGWDLALIFFVVVALAPIEEELLFRGYLQGYLFRGQPLGLAIAVQGLAFGMAHHGNWPDPVPLTLLGAALGREYARTGSLLTPIFFHATFNAFMLTIAVANEVHS